MKINTSAKPAKPATIADPRCIAVTIAGSRCKLTAVEGLKKCRIHIDQDTRHGKPQHPTL